MILDNTYLSEFNRKIPKPNTKEEIKKLQEEYTKKLNNDLLKDNFGQAEKYLFYLWIIKLHEKRLTLIEKNNGKKIKVKDIVNNPELLTTGTVWNWEEEIVLDMSKTSIKRANKLRLMEKRKKLPKEEWQNNCKYCYKGRCIRYDCTSCNWKEDYERCGGAEEIE